MNQESMNQVQMNPIRTVIFAKAPLPGLAKTRLIPALGSEGSAALARRLLEHTVAQALAADIGPVELCVTPTMTHPIWNELAIPTTVCWSEQGDGDLGERLDRVSQRVTESGEALMVIGTDCPQLDAKRLREAAQSLANNDACLVPVSDGGYALLGVHQHHPSLFSDIPWSTDQVAELTRHRIKSMDWSIELLEQLHDIDVPDDLQLLPKSWLATSTP